MLASGHFVVEANGKQCDARKEEEYDDADIKLGLSNIDHEGEKRCAITGTLVGNTSGLDIVALQLFALKDWSMKVSG